MGTTPVSVDKNTKNIISDYNLCMTESEYRGAHGVTGDPRFVDPGKGVYWLREDSPARGKGSSQYAPAKDFWGRSYSENQPVDIGTWAVTRSMAGARAFTITSEPTVPERLLGIVTIPMGSYRYAQLPHSPEEGRSRGQLYLPASPERSFEKLCFRDNFDRDGQYLVLEGYQTSEMAR